MTRPQRIAIVGATGAVGSELVELLEERRFPLEELRPIASERSLGDEVEVLGFDLPVDTDPEPAALTGLDRVFLCAPQAAALEWVRRCLKDQAPCIDLSGALVSLPEVPLIGTAEAVGAPLSVVAPPATIALTRVAKALGRVTPLRRLIATCLMGAASAGRRGVDALQAESIALFNQSEVPTSEVFGREIAFDAMPLASEALVAPESAMVASIGRLLPDVPASISALQVPVFAGLGIQAVFEGLDAFDLAAVVDALAKAPGIELAVEPTSTRDALGSDSVHIARLEADPALQGGVKLWLSADPIRLAAVAAIDAALPQPRHDA